MKIGDIIEAEVVQIHEGFAQLSLKNYTANLMQTEITWAAGTVDISEHLKKHQRINVRVTDLRGNALSVSLKQAESNPWEEPPEIGQQYSSQVVRVTEYGYFMRIEWYCDALLHISDARSSHQVGDTIDLKVSKVEPNRHRVQVVEICNVLTRRCSRQFTRCLPCGVVVTPLYHKANSA